MGIIVENTRPIRVLAISGSLRRASSNSALVAAAMYVAPSVVHVSVFHDLAELPPFNPDIESVCSRVPPIQESHNNYSSRQ